MRPFAHHRGSLTLLAGTAAFVLAAALSSTAQAQAQSSPCTGFGVEPVQLDPTLPKEFNGQQLEADCMAWQSFISLNWAADPKQRGRPDPQAPPASFGDPNDKAPKVWESFYEVSSVFDPDPATASGAAERPAVKLLTRISKQGATDLSLSGISQAGDGKWLTSQTGQLTYYEVLINPDERAYITENSFNGADLTTFKGQAACAAAEGGFLLPSGSGDVDCLGKPASYGDNVGAIEIKASWLPLPPDHSLDYRYKTSEAVVVDPMTGGTKRVTVGLVGLHIIRKVKGADQFVWATFEQIDNDPDQTSSGVKAPDLPKGGHHTALNCSASSKGCPYTYFNENCDPANDPVYKCTPNKEPTQPCSSTGQIACNPYGKPMQITRVVPVDQTANAVTGYVWSLLPAQSVYNYYRLVDVQWPQNSTGIDKTNNTIPLPPGDIQPSSQTEIVANTTMETFQQTKNACMDCHKYAPVASEQNLLVRRQGARDMVTVQPRVASPTFGSDYSFVFATETRH